MDEPKVIRSEIASGSGAPRREISIASTTSAVLDERDRVAYDTWVARRTFDLLERHYPGHFWKVDVSSKKGVASIHIPILMGGNWVYVIKWEDLTPAMIVRAGGEILERYGLRRGRFELGQFLEARQKHSILAGVGRLVPN